jgi:hypothetical protein
LVAECHITLVRWRNYFCQVRVHGFNDIRQTEIHTAEPLVPGPSASDVDMAIGKIKSYKSPGI